MAVAGFHVEVSSGAATSLSGGGDGLHLGRSGSLRVEVSLAGDITGRGGDDAAEVGVGCSETGGFVGDEGGAFDVRGVERVVGGGFGAFADNG